MDRDGRVDPDGARRWSRPLVLVVQFGPVALAGAVEGPKGITHRTFYDPQGSKRVGLIFEIPDMNAFQELMQSEAAAEAMKYDGVHPDTILVLQEG